TYCRTNKLSMKTIHPNSRKAGQVRKRLHHDQRVLRRQKQNTVRNKQLENKLQWFRDNFPKDRAYLSHNEQLALAEQSSIPFRSWDGNPACMPTIKLNVLKKKKKNS
ncbi:uncharacterized protein DEA37_0001932, partial [Paragonimus westermani]